MARNRIDNGTTATVDNSNGTATLDNGTVQAPPVDQPITDTTVQTPPVAPVSQPVAPPARQMVKDMTINQIFEKRGQDGATTIKGKSKTEHEGRAVKLDRVVSHDGDAPVLAALTAASSLTGTRVSKRGDAVLSDRVMFAQYEAACVIAKLLGLPCPTPPASHPDYVPPAGQ